MWLVLLLLWPAHGSAAACRDGAACVPLQAATVTAIQIHGNTLTPDDEIRRMADVHEGMSFETNTVAEVTDRLRATRRFKTVEVRQRFASISDPSQIVLVIIVDEGPVRIEMTGDRDRPTRVVRSRRMNLLVMPVLGAEDGYGATYGGRVAILNPIGARSQLAVPLTWGGEKRAAAELDKTMARGPIDRVTSGASVSRRTNPFFREDDDRTRVWAGAERRIAGALRGRTTAGWQRAAFGDAVDRFLHVGAEAVFDTRVDPALPRNAVYAKAAWEHLMFSARDANRTELDARGYIGALGQSIVALRALRLDSDRPLPPYLQPLLGGMSNLRGFRAGTAAGDTLVAGSAELIVPLTSPLDVGKMGVTVFADYGTVYAKGERLADQRMDRGYGGSLWFTAAFLRLNIAAAHGVGSSTRMHVGASVTF